MWVILDRRRWLSPFRAPGQFETMSRKQLLARALAHFQSERTALMVAQVRRVGESWCEHERGLLVHPGWPWRVIE